MDIICLTTYLASSVRDLNAVDIPMRKSSEPLRSGLNRIDTAYYTVEDMIRLAFMLVPSDPKLGFHIPPFSSVPHLHLHVLAGKRTFLGRIKYPIARHEGGKGWSWFVSAEQTIEILQREGSVGVGRC